MDDRFPWLWDTDMDNAAFEALLRGERSASPRDSNWAMARLIEYAPYREIRRLLPRNLFLRQVVAPRLRSRARRKGMQYLYNR